MIIPQLVQFSIILSIKLLWGPADGDNPANPDTAIGRLPRDHRLPPPSSKQKSPLRLFPTYQIIPIKPNSQSSGHDISSAAMVNLNDRNGNPTPDPAVTNCVRMCACACVYV